MKRASTAWTAALCSVAGIGGVGVAYQTISTKYDSQLSSFKESLALLHRRLEEQDQIIRQLESTKLSTTYTHGNNLNFCSLDPPTSYANVVESVSPAIVSLVVESDDDYVTFGGLWKVKQPKRAMGSGVIVRSDGIIATNNHVIAMADQYEMNYANNNKDIRYTVHLHDGTTYNAIPLLKDELNDLALLKILSKKDENKHTNRKNQKQFKQKNKIANFPFLRIGNVTSMRIGDRVLAIGNNFGFQNTVTDGIISAIGRSYSNTDIFTDFTDENEIDNKNDWPDDNYTNNNNNNNNNSTSMDEQKLKIGKNPYLPFLQTNANINQGSSGGPLIDVKTKELIGINTAIASPIGVNIGIAFSVPASYVLNLLRSLDEPYNGQFIIRPWDGLRVKKCGILTRKIENINNNNDSDNNIINENKEYTYGVSIVDMHSHSPAKEAGIYQNDILIGINDVIIDTPDKYWMVLSQIVPDCDEPTKYTILRYNHENRKYELKQFNVSVTLPYQSQNNLLTLDKDIRRVFDACKFAELQPFNGIEIGQSAADSGVLILELPVWGRAYRVFGFEPGDVILEINGVVMDDLKKFEKMLKDKTLRELHFVIKRNELIGEITIRG